MEPVPDRGPLHPDDLDNDGIPNAVDLCPTTYDPDQHDEDGDGVGDACDVCPSVADDQTDSAGSGFGDGLGDACDPRPSRDGDTLAAFEPFIDAADEELWVGSGWRIGADVARAISPARWEHVEKASGDGLYAEIAVPLLIWLDSSGSVEVGLDGDGDASVAGLTCTLVHDPAAGPDRLVAREVISGRQSAIPVGHVKAPFTLSAWRTIAFDRTSRLRCQLGASQLDLDVDAVSAGTWSFASVGAITDVSSVVVYTFPINPCTRSAGAPMCSDGPGN